MPKPNRKYNPVFKERQNSKYPHGRPNPEKIWIEEWEQDNYPHQGRNHGFGILQDLMITHKDYKYDGVNRDDFLLGSRYSITPDRKMIYEITDREQNIAATLIQWLGTNCGHEFVCRCLKRCGYNVIPIVKW